MLTGPIRNSDICYTCVHLFLTVQATFLWYYYQQTEPESCPHSAQRAGQSPQQDKHNNNRKTSNDKSPDELFQIHFEICLTYGLLCGEASPPPPLFTLWRTPNVKQIWHWAKCVRIVFHTISYCRSWWCIGLLQLACWDCGFQSRWMSV
jgi:hypothetical protein